MLIVSSAILPAAHALHVIPGRPARPALGVAGRASVRMDDTMNTVIGGAALLVGVGGGVGLIAFAENAGKQNEERQNVQPCVVCTGKMVVDCTICSGSAWTSSLTWWPACARRWETKSPQARSPSRCAPSPPHTTVATAPLSKPTRSRAWNSQDWDDGPLEVVPYAEVLAKFPVKATEKVCASCDGRGLVICDNCGATGIQPRFLERFSPDDFMD